MQHALQIAGQCVAPSACSAWLPSSQTSAHEGQIAQPTGCGGGGTFLTFLWPSCVQQAEVLYRILSFSDCPSPLFHLLLLPLRASNLQLLQQEIIDETDLYVDNMQVGL